MASTGNNTPPLTAYQCHQRGACWRRCLFEFIAGMSHVSEFQPSWLTVDGQVIMPSSKRLRRLPSHTYQQPTLEMWPGQSSFLHVSSTWTENTSKSARSQGQRRKKKKDQASTWRGRLQIKHRILSEMLTPVDDLRTRRFGEPTLRPSGAPNHWKNTVFRDFPTFSRICIFFLLTLSLLLFFLLIFLFSLPLPCSAFHLSILSEVWLLNFLRLFICIHVVHKCSYYFTTFHNYSDSKCPATQLPHMLPHMPHSSHALFGGSTTV